MKSLIKTIRGKDNNNNVLSGTKHPLENITLARKIDRFHMEEWSN